ncbi:MAG: hypothetical protein ACD_73C00013G0001, partial [uncultured bacterium]
MEKSKWNEESEQLSLWDCLSQKVISSTDKLAETSSCQTDGFQLSFPVSTKNFSIHKIDFVKIILLDDNGLQDAILFVTQSQEGLFHLIYFEKMNENRENPKRLEIVLSSSGENYQRVGDHQHWEIDMDCEYDVKQWQQILAGARVQVAEPREQFLL